MEALARHDDLVRDQLAHLPLGTRRRPDAAGPIRAGIAGSGDDLLVLTWSAAELAAERAAGARVFAGFGITAGMRIANALPGALATPGALLVGDVVEEIGGLDVPLGVPESEAGGRAVWELVDRVEPAVVILDPGLAPAVLAAAPARGRPWWCGIVWLRRLDSPPAPAVPAAAGFAGWQRAWLAVPEVTSFVAGSCARGRFHADPGVRADVEQGELVLAPRAGETAPLRYATGVRARPVVGPCGCGDARPALELP